MSFEGFLQILCKNGHLREYDVYDPKLERYKCPLCKASVAYTHLVDETNGYDPTDPSACRKTFEVVVPATTERCNLGHLHLTSEAIYKIPQ